MDSEKDHGRKTDFSFAKSPVMPNFLGYASLKERHPLPEILVLGKQKKIMQSNAVFEVPLMLHWLHGW